MIKKHMRKSQQYPQGQIVEREGTDPHLECDERRRVRRAGGPAWDCGAGPGLKKP